jgi:serine/threonine protein kinase/WD40 repeat protein
VTTELPGGVRWMLGGLAPGSVLAGYRVEAQLGAGGMAVVFRARDEALGRTVALKVLTPALAGDAEFRERFIRESRAAAAVDHPYIIPVYAAGEADGVLHIAMRFVSGGDLRSICRREGPLSGERAVSLLSPVASALDAAHAAGLVHRDVKPANILVDMSQGRPDHPYLSDFGLAKGTSATGMTGTGQFMGTPDFSAPEQISGKAISPQTDQYALACVVFTTLTGALPFAREESMAVLWAHMYEPPPSVTTRRPDLPAAVDWVLARALAKTPADRYGSCGEFIDALRGALGVASYSDGLTGFARSGSAALPSPTPTVTSIPPATTQPPGSVGNGVTHRRHSANPASRSRSRGPWVAVAAAVAVLLAGGAAAGYALFGPPPGGTQLAANGSAHASGATSPSAPAAGRGVTVTSAGQFNNPSGVAVAASAFGENGTLDAVDSNGSVYVFDTASRQLVETLPLAKLGTGGALLSPDGSTLADPIGAGCADGSTACELTLIDLSARQQQKVGIGMKVLKTATVAFKDIISIGDGTLAAIDSIRNGVDLVNLTSGADLGELNDPDQHYIVGTAISQNDQVVATSSNGGTTTHTVYIWNVASRSVSKTLAVPQNAGFAGIDRGAIGPPLALDRDGTTLAVTDGVTTYVYDTQTGRLISKIPAGLVALSPDGTLIAAIGQTAGQVRLWNVGTGKVVASLPRLPVKVMPSTVVFSDDGTSVAVGCNDGSTYVYRVAGG